MSLDYWRNEEKTCTLSYDDGYYHIWIMEDEASGDCQMATVNIEDLANLQRSISVILDQ